MKSLFRNLVVLTCLLTAVLPLAAQGVTAEIDEDIHVVVPDGWMVLPAELYDEYFAEVSNLEAAVVTDDNLTILILTPSQIEGLLDGEELPEDASDLLVDVYNRIYDFEIEPDELEVEQIGALEAQVWYYVYGEDEEAGEGEAYVLTADGETASSFFVDVYGPEGSIEEAREEIDLILDSIANPPEVAGPPATGDPCTVETNTERSATVRVGPGENRTAITFLKASQSYTVEGRFEVDVIDVWYKLAKDEVDPGSSAAELWVSANDVNAIGDCANVGEAAAPPLRPIVGARPTTVPGDTNSGGGEDPGTTVTGGVTPASGTWVFSYAERATISCAGGGFGDFPIADIDIPASETFSITAAADGSSLTVSGDHFPRINETLFLGDYNFGSSNGQVYLFPQSANNMSLEIRANVVVDGVSCSATIYGSASRR